MIKQLTRTAVVVLAAVGLVAALPAPAPAAGALAFTGTASVTPTLGYPFGVPTGGGTGTWSLVATGSGVRPGDSSLFTGNGLVNGQLHDGSLNFGPYCGFTGGHGSGNLAGWRPVFDLRWDQSVGDLIVFSSEGVQGVMLWLPPVDGWIGTGSCAQGTAKTFTVVGWAVAI